MTRFNINWKPIAWLSLAFGVFFAISAAGQYWFVTLKIRQAEQQSLEPPLQQIAQAVGAGEKVDIERYNKALIDAPNYAVVLSDGTVLDVETTTFGVIPGLISGVELPPFPSEYFGNPAPYLSSIGERWTIFAKRVQGGYVILGTSALNDAASPDDLLRRNMALFGSTLEQALAVGPNPIDNQVDYAILDTNGVVRAAAGKVPIKANPLAVANTPTGVFERSFSGKTVLVLKDVLMSQSGHAQGVAFAWADITGEQQVLNNELYFGIALAIMSWLLFLAIALRYWSKTEADKRNLRQAFQNYLSPQVMDAILKEPENLKLGGQRREVTILFSDIRSFTGLAERLPPQELTRLLQEYFNEMTDEVIANQGVVDKYIGDAIMAFWGAPIDQLDQADRAVRTAVNMVKRLKCLKEKWVQEGYGALNIGIGINLGVATVGNFGSEKRFDYTLIGDAVNTASRLEGLTKDGESHIIISESTLKQLTIKVKTKDLGTVQLKGRAEPLHIFEVEP